MADQSQRKKYGGEYDVIQKNIPVERKWVVVVAKDAKKDLDIDSINLWADQLRKDRSKLVNIGAAYSALIPAYSGCLTVTDSSGNTITAEKLIEDTKNSIDPLNIGAQSIATLASGNGDSILEYCDRIKEECLNKFNTLQDGYNTDAETEVNNVAEPNTVKGTIASSTEAEGRTDGHIKYYTGVI